MKWKMLICGIVLFQANLIIAQDSPTDTLQYFDYDELANSWLVHLDYCLDWGNYYDLNVSNTDFSIKKIEFLFATYTEEFMNEWGPDSIEVFFKEALNDSAPGPGVYHTLKVFFSDSNNTVYPNWTSIDLQDIPALRELPSQFWVTSRFLWWSCYDTLNPSGHSRVDIDHAYWTNVQDFAIRLIYEYQSNGVKQEISITPGSPSISSIYPNPFNGGTTFSYYLPSDGNTLITVYDLSGHVIRSFPEGYQSAGIHNLPWDGKTSIGTSAPTGVYFLNLKYLNNTHRHSISKKLLMLK